MWVVLMMVVLIDSYLWLSCFPSMDFTKQMLLSRLEKLISKLPSVRYNLPKTLMHQTIKTKPNQYYPQKNKAKA
jgi:hypothetical protein